MEELQGCRAVTSGLGQKQGLSAWPEDGIVRMVRRGPRERAGAGKAAEIWETVPYFLLISLIWGLVLYLAAASLQ